MALLLIACLWTLFSLQLVEYPSEGFQYRLMFVLLANVIGVFVWDRLMLAIFAPHVLRASIAATRPEVRQLAGCQRRRRREGARQERSETVRRDVVGGGEEWDRRGERYCKSSRRTRKCTSAKKRVHRQWEKRQVEQSRRDPDFRFAHSTVDSTHHHLDSKRHTSHLRRTCAQWSRR